MYNSLRYGFQFKYPPRISPIETNNISMISFVSANNQADLTIDIIQDKDFYEYMNKEIENINNTGELVSNNDIGNINPALQGKFVEYRSLGNTYKYVYLSNKVNQIIVLKNLSQSESYSNFDQILSTFTFID